MAASTSRDIISVVEAAYRTDGTDAEWLGELLGMAQPWLDGGLGVAAFLYDASAPGAPRIWAPVAHGSPYAAGFPDMLPIAFAAAPADIDAISAARAEPRLHPLPGPHQLLAEGR